MSTRRNMPQTAWRRRLPGGAALLPGLVALAAATACSTDPVAAPPAAQAFHAGVHRNLASATTTVGALTRTSPLASDITVSTTVTSHGGRIVIPEAGLSVSFPAGFVSAPTTFWVTAKAGAAVAYDFGPSGTFSAPVTITQKLQGTDAFKANAAALQGAYVQDWAQLDASAKRAAVSELLPANVDVQGNKLSFDVWHFSGYMVSTGRSLNQDDQGENQQ